MQRFLQVILMDTLSVGGLMVKGMEIEDLFVTLNLTQIISEPTNFQPGKRPPCIDLIVNGTT